MSFVMSWALSRYGDAIREDAKYSEIMMPVIQVSRLTVVGSTLMRVEDKDLNNSFNPGVESFRKNAHADC